MATTTIKVSQELRDRLRAEAAKDRSTLGALLESMLEERARAQRFEDLRGAIAATPAPDMTSWTHESEAWDATANDGPAS